MGKVFYFIKLGHLPNNMVFQRESDRSKGINLADIGGILHSGIRIASTQFPNLGMIDSYVKEK